MSSLGLECHPLLDFLLAAATLTTGNAVPVTLRDETKLDLEPPPVCLTLSTTIGINYRLFDQELVVLVKLLRSFEMHLLLYQR